MSTLLGSCDVMDAVDALEFRYESLPDLTGQTAVITGCSSGLGAATALELARKGARVLCLGRKEEKTRDVIGQITNETGNNKLEFIHCDLLSLASVQAAAETVLSKNVPVNMLILNAGVIGSPTEMQRSQDGIEVTWATNHLSHFLLTILLIPLLERSIGQGAPTRVVSVSSISQSMTGYREGIRFDAYDDAAEYKFLHRYAETKLANILMSRELQRRVEEKYGAGVPFYSNSCHPGIVNTAMGEDHVRPWLKNVVSGVKRIFMTTPNQGAKSIVYLAASSDVQTLNLRGKFYIDRARPSRPGDLCPAASDMDLAKRLWEWSFDVVRGKGVKV
ncbi:NAD(P)-binding protein [Gonapodya prolifera JEL478]|uniref:NAD(P)-binding protein n=1 Tax=Gonapodya prolifera (strain JEL478) TaxID=1344416 RepID=A0A139A523_GONPJ|nr:NAD(P)-binding protein [Gonapodya prolifera JEL478]|eukprot:KXS11841.1 NAD(P)-binding protein [Gonapodya prolifera JEL478]